LYGREFLHQSASTVKADKMLDFYIRLAFACADGNFPIDRAQAFLVNGNAKGMAKIFKLNEDGLPLILDKAALGHASAYRDLLETLAGLYLDYRECGLPFLPELSLALPDNADGRSEAVEEQWFGTGFSPGRAIRDDMKKKAYFGSPSALHAELFVETARRIRNSVFKWLMSTEKSAENRDNE
jgi:hypothetical protein